MLRKNFAICAGVVRIVKLKDVKAAEQVARSTKIGSAYKIFDREACKTIINFSTGALEIGCVLMVNGGGYYNVSSWGVGDGETAGFFKRRLTWLLFFPLGKFRCRWEDNIK